MVKKSEDKILKSNPTKQLLQTMVLIKNENDMLKFLRDILTIQELKSMSERFQVALLLSKKVSYREIEKQTGTSSATIARVNQWLNFGMDGYKKAIELLNATKQEKSLGHSI